MSSQYNGQMGIFEDYEGCDSLEAMLKGMNHTVVDGETRHEYVGFQAANFGGVSPMGAGFSVIAWFDGEPELWFAESPAGIIELRRYYKDQWGDQQIPFTVSQLLYNTDGDDFL